MKFENYRHYIYIAIFIVAISAFYTYINKNYRIKDKFTDGTGNCNGIKFSGSGSSTGGNNMLALYHGGMPGAGYYSEAEWQSYCQNYWSFVNQVKSINSIMFVCTDAGQKCQGDGVTKKVIGDCLIDYWLDCNSSSEYNGEMGFTVFPSGKYSWTWNCNVKGQAPGSACMNNKLPNDGKNDDFYLQIFNTPRSSTHCQPAPPPVGGGCPKACPCDPTDKESKQCDFISTVGHKWKSYCKDAGVCDGVAPSSYKSPTFKKSEGGRACSALQGWSQGGGYCAANCKGDFDPAHGTWCEKGRCKGCNKNVTCSAEDVDGFKTPTCAKINGVYDYNNGCDPNDPDGTGNKAAEGCPNNWEQALNYITYVNILQLDKGRKDQLISFIAVDGEGEGGYTDDVYGWCPLNKALAWAQDLPYPRTKPTDKPGSGKTNNRNKVIGPLKKPDGSSTGSYKLSEIFPTRFQTGVAHGPGNFCAPGSGLESQTCDLIGTTRAYPELYWIGELLATNCNLNTKTGDNSGSTNPGGGTHGGGTNGGGGEGWWNTTFTSKL